MALGPKQILEKIKSEDDRRNAVELENRRRALTLVESVAELAEKLLDKTILARTERSIYVYFREIEREFEYGKDANLVFYYAKEELQKALEKRYLPSGWEKVYIGQTTPNYGGGEYYINLKC